MNKIKKIFPATISLFLIFSAIIPSISAAYTPYPNQKLDIENVGIVSGTTSASIDFAEVSNVSGSTINISIFGKAYVVDISSASLSDFNGTVITAGQITTGSKVNIRGYLDSANQNLIHAQIVRSQSVIGGGNNGGDSSACTIRVISNTPTNWLIGGPITDGQFVKSPNYPIFTPSATYTRDTSGNPLTAGIYGIQLPQTADGWTNPVVTPAASQMCQSGGSITFAIAYANPNGSGGSTVVPHNITAQNLFTLSPEERALFTPPDPSWLNDVWTGYEGPPLRNAWNAFNTNSLPATLDPGVGSPGWYDPIGSGSQNHSILWMGMSALSNALQGNIAQYDAAAQNSMRLLALNKQQGHQRFESLGYGTFWTGGVAAMAMAGLYAPAGSTSGPQLLTAAREWWADHVTILRSLRMPDGQVAILGARQTGNESPGTTDSWHALSAALIMQIADPIPYNQLHPSISALITADGNPARGLQGSTVVWHRPREGVTYWLVLRAVQSGAFTPVPASHSMPAVAMDVYKWTSGSRTYIATPATCGYPPSRWKLSWAPGEVLRVDLANNSDSGKGPWLAPSPLNMPDGAIHLFGPIGAGTRCVYY